MLLHCSNDTSKKKIRGQKHSRMRICDNKRLGQVLIYKLKDNYSSTFPGIRGFQYNFSTNEIWKQTYCYFYSIQPATCEFKTKK